MQNTVTLTGKQKLKKFLDIREAGAENPALKRQLEHVVAEPYRQHTFRVS